MGGQLGILLNAAVKFYFLLSSYYNLIMIPTLSVIIIVINVVNIHVIIASNLTVITIVSV